MSVIGTVGLAISRFQRKILELGKLARDAQEASRLGSSHQYLPARIPLDSTRQVSFVQSRTDPEGALSENVDLIINNT